MVTTDELQAVHVFVDDKNPPSFISFHEHLDESGSSSGVVAVKGEGTLTSVLESNAHKHLYKITGIFTAEINDVSGSNVSKLTLVGLRAFSTHDNILKKNKVTNATVFGK